MCLYYRRRINFNKEDTEDAEMKLRISKAWQITKSTNGLLWSSEMWKGKKSNCGCLTPLSFSVWIWGVASKRPKKKIEAIEIDALRRAAI